MTTQHEYSSTQVNLPEKLAAKVITWGKENVPEFLLYRDPDDPSFGRETEPHVTILYGFYETNAQKVRHTVSHEDPFEVTLGEINVFRNEHFDVVKIDVVDSQPLHDLNELLKQKFAHRKTFPDYSPHVTIAYLKKGRGEKFKGDQTFEGERFHARQIVFSSPTDKCVLSLRGRVS